MSENGESQVNPHSIFNCCNGPQLSPQNTRLERLYSQSVNGDWVMHTPYLYCWSDSRPGYHHRVEMNNGNARTAPVPFMAPGLPLGGFAQPSLGEAGIPCARACTCDAYHFRGFCKHMKSANAAARTLWLDYFADGAQLPPGTKRVRKALAIEKRRGRSSPARSDSAS